MNYLNLNEELLRVSFHRFFRETASDLLNLINVLTTIKGYFLQLAHYFLIIQNSCNDLIPSTNSDHQIA